MSLVSLVKIKGSNLKQALLQSLNLINYKFPKSTQNIAIKPNMCYYWDYSTGQTTDPQFIAALVDVIRDKISPDVNISIVESDASAMKCKYAFGMLGYKKLVEDYGLTLVNLSDDESENLDVRVEDELFNFEIPLTIKNADLRINVTKIKYTFEPIRITCALKNIFGCNPYRRKFKYHPKLGKTIIALNKIMRFDLCLLDGYIVSGVQPRKLGLLMASEDPVAFDAAASEIAGLNPKTIRYLKLAEKEGLGNVRFLPTGVPLGYFKDRYPRKGIKPKLMSRAYDLVLRLRLGKRLGLD